jgi:hypothetical protein
VVVLIGLSDMTRATSYSPMFFWLARLSRYVSVQRRWSLDQMECFLYVCLILRAISCELSGKFPASTLKNTVMI